MLHTTRAARGFRPGQAIIAGLCVLAITPLISLARLDIRSLYPGYIVWGRSVVRLALAVLLFYLRPRERVGGDT